MRKQKINCGGRGGFQARLWWLHPLGPATGEEEGELLGIGVIQLSRAGAPTVTFNGLLL